MISTAEDANEEFYFRDVTLLDGRRLIFDIRVENIVSSDIEDHKFDFRWADPDVAWHHSLVKILLGMLSTHSLVYSNRLSYYVGRCLNDKYVNCLIDKETFGVRFIEDWPTRYGVKSWPFIKALLNRWHSTKLPGLSPEIVEFLKHPETFEERSSGWYFALVANDPERGAFTEQELRSIKEGIDRAFAEGSLSLSEWAIVWFLIATGVRPVQMARTKMSDVIVTTGPEGREITLAIPLAKGENQIMRDRWKRKAPSVLAEVLLRYLESPTAMSRQPSDPLFEDQSAKISDIIASVFRRVETYSERLRGPIPVFPYRFRYTLGTRAIALGATDHEAARLLTHRTTTCIQYYRAAMPMLQGPIKEAIGQEMSFLAQAFQGRLIGSLDEATRKGQAGALIRDFAHLMGQSLGACGTNAECHQHAPRACLSCRKFEPLMDAPWEQLLSVLHDDLVSETEDRIRLITQEQIDAVHGIIAQRDRRSGGGGHE